MKRMFFFTGFVMFGMFLIVSIMAGDVIVDKTKDNVDVFTLTEADESNIKVNAGQPFFFRIKSNLTTGYSWEFAQPLDKDKLEFIGKIHEGDEMDDSPDRKLLGASGFEVFKFKALIPGQTAILLKLVRPWEKEVEPTKRHKINVTIE
jgi:predicted secreted protein